MLRLKKLKQEKDAAAEAKKAGKAEVTSSPGELRIQKEVGEVLRPNPHQARAPMDT